MTNLRLEKYLGQWQLHNVSSGRLLTTSTEETKKLLKQLASKDGDRFILQIA